VDLDAGVHALVLECADELQARAVAGVGQAGIAVAAEGTLVDQTVLGAVEDRAPGLELADAVGGVLGVQLGHAPLVQELAPAHGVAKVHPPVVPAVVVAQAGGAAAFGHDGVGLAQQALADQAGVQPQGRALDGSPQASAAGADHHHVVLKSLDLGDVGCHGISPRC